MIQFTKPQNLNGAELVDELKAAGIVATKPTIDGDDNFWLDLDAKDESKAKPIIAAHNGTMIAREQTLVEKLASVGLSIEELKAALA
jgi:hypothetical protein